jgi:hypothetical protein
MMASSEFCKMLWKLEPGRNYDEADPLNHDDDRTAFIDVCMMRHHQSRNERAVPLSRSAGTAVVFHKYACANMLQQLVCWPLYQFFGSSMEQSHVADFRGVGLRPEDAMCISYLSGDAKLFYRCTRYIISRMPTNQDHSKLQDEQSTARSYARDAGR